MSSTMLSRGDVALVVGVTAAVAIANGTTGWNGLAAVWRVCVGVTRRAWSWLRRSLRDTGALFVKMWCWGSRYIVKYMGSLCWVVRGRMGDLCRYVDIMVWLEGCRQCAACHCEGVSNAFDNVREVKSAGERSGSVASSDSRLYIRILDWPPIRRCLLVP